MAEGAPFKIDTAGVDPEIANIPGPQLVVPITNARFALNAANARWGSLYDALYGTDALGDLPAGKGYDPKRGARVIDWAKGFLDKAAPLSTGQWSSVDGVSVSDGALTLTAGGNSVALASSDAFVGFGGDADAPDFVLLHRRQRSGGHLGRAAGIGHVHDHGLRRQRRGGGRRGQGRGLWQLAGPDDRRSARDL